MSPESCSYQVDLGFKEAFLQEEEFAIHISSLLTCCSHSHSHLALSHTAARRACDCQEGLKLWTKQVYCANLNTFLHQNGLVVWVKGVVLTLCSFGETMPCTYLAHHELESFIIVSLS